MASQYSCPECKAGFGHEESCPWLKREHDKRVAALKRWGAWPETHESSDGCTIDGPPGIDCGCQSCRHNYGDPGPDR